MTIQKQGLFPQVYIDIDDVLAETLRAFTDLLRTSFNITVDFNDIFSFDLGKSFKLSPEQLSKFMTLAHQPAILLSIQPIKGAREVLQEWKEKGVYITVITGRPASTLEISRKWLRENHIPFDSLLAIDKYGRDKGDSIPRPLSLRSILKSNFFLAVEDSPKMARFISYHVDTPVALIDRPWNQKISRFSNEFLSRIIRCKDWYEVNNNFEQLINEFSKSKSIL